MTKNPREDVMSQPIAWIWTYPSGVRSLRWRPDYDPSSSDVPASVTPLYAIPISDLEARQGRIPDLEGARRNADYYLAEAKHPDVESNSAVIFFEQAINAWKNAAYAMADQRDAARSQSADLEALMADGWRLVPGVLTDAMWAAWRDCGYGPETCYRAMLAAAPLPEAIAKAREGK